MLKITILTLVIALHSIIPGTMEASDSVKEKAIRTVQTIGKSLTIKSLQ